MPPSMRRQLHPLLSFAPGILLAACFGLSHAQQPRAPAAPASPQLRAGEPVMLNFVDAEIEAVARAMASLTGRSLVVDPRVKGQITLLGETPISPEQAWQQFLAALRLHGHTVVEAAGLYKLVPESDGKLQTGQVRIGGRAPGGRQIVTQIFRLNYENAANLVPLLRSLISPNNTINVNPSNNSLVITDYADNLQRIERIVASMDVPGATDVEVIPLRHAIASDMVALVSRLLEGEGGSGSVPLPPAGGNAAARQAPMASGNAFKTTLIAEPRSNSVVLRAANAARLAQAKALIGQLDQPPAQGEAGDQGSIHVIHLKNADAVAMAATLRAALAAQETTGGNAMGGAGAASGGGGASTSGGSSDGTGGGNSAGLGSTGLSTEGNLGTARQPSTGGMIQAEPSTNSLVITAPAPLMRQLRAVIDRLDSRRAQVLIESLIVEVNDNQTAQFGVQWQAILSSGGRILGTLGTNSNLAGANILGLLGLLDEDGKAPDSETLARMQGGNLGLTQRINGQDTLGFLASFLQGSGQANILSTPHILTLDNDEARIVVGQNVPLVTGAYTNPGTGANLNPFTTVERQDVGLMLRVRPQINENGTVKLTVFQEVSSVDEATRQDPNGLTTNKRSIESNVLVEDGNIVVLGGLLDDNYAQARDKVPLLGDLPLIGNLFRSTNRRRNKTNLMVFLRPVILRDAAASTQLAADRYGQIQALQKSSQPDAHPMLPIHSAPILPALPAAGATSFGHPLRMVNLPRGLSPRRHSIGAPK